MEKQITKNLIEGVGQEAVLALGLTERNLRHIRSAGVIPPRWYAAIKKLADAKGIDCPLCAFGFEGVE